ncbi:unnamed protein product [Penicillium salamii]|nr:unnamed protein product [Penicillium salamii]CAG8428245.1 unnamed protein product [Penicillium salamii]
MCRAFHSLQPSTLEELFGPCPDDGGEYSGMGLNVVSPLYQGKPIGTMARHALSQQWDNSPDPDISGWSSFRKAHRKKQSKWSPSERRPFTPREYYSILQEAISKSCIGNYHLDINQMLPPDTDSIPWGDLGEEEPSDTDSWFETTMANLQEQMNNLPTAEEVNSPDKATPNDFIRPVGTSNASIGLVFGSVPSHPYKANDGSKSPESYHLPWGLKESGFDQSNSLIWSYNLQKFALIPGEFQSRPLSPLGIQLLKRATKKLIVGSKLRVIVMCGKEVEQVVLPDEILISGHITFMSDDMDCHVWVEHDGSRILRLFVRSPSPLSELWSSNGRMTCRITTIFRLISGLTGVKIHPAFFESTLIVTLVIRGWYDEKNGQIPPVSPQELDPLLRLWLTEKGFTTDGDLLRLTEAAGGSLRLGIQVMCASHPNKARRSKHASFGVLKSKKPTECDHWPANVFSQVQALFREKAPLLFINRNRSFSEEKQELEFTDEAPDRAANQAKEKHLVGEDIGLHSFSHETQQTPSIPEYLIQFDEAESKPDETYMNLDEAQASLDESQPDSIRLMLGSKHQGYRGKRAQGCYQFTIRHVGFSINTQLKPNGGFWIKAELSPVGERHPYVWATGATLQDPGSRLAIRVEVRGSSDRKIGVEYPSADFWQACYKANRLVDELNGDSCFEISKRPRRHIFVDGRHKRFLKEYPELEKYLGGAFNDNDGNIVRDSRPQRPRTSRNSRKSDANSENKFENTSGGIL